MTPDLPRLRERFAQFFQIFLRERARFHLGGLSRIPSTSLLEGDSNSIDRSDGTSSDIPMESAEARLVVPRGEALPFEAVLEKLDGVAKELASQQARMMYRTVGEAAESAGNSVDFGGRKFTTESFLEGLKGLAVDFDENGQPTVEIHAPPNSPMVALAKAAEQSSEAKKLIADFWSSKYEDWRAREADRILAG